MFKKVLIANRGAIACRIQRTLRRMRIGAVAVYSDVDKHSLHVSGADESVSLGGATAAESYLRQDKLIEAARATGATAVHPGAINTELGRHMTPEVLKGLMDAIAASKTDDNPGMRFKSVPQGAATTVWAGFVAPADAVGGRYCEDCHVAEITAVPGLGGGVCGYALDPENAKALWAKSEEMVGERF